MPRRFLPFLLAVSLGLVAACGEDDHPQTPEVPPYAGYDNDSPGVGFTSTGFTVPERDASGFVQLLWNGTLRLDRWDELPRRVHEARITAAEVEGVRALAEDPRVQALLRGEAEDGCSEPPSDFYHFLNYREADQTFSLNVVGCQEPAIDALARELGRLRELYLPAE